ncbi:hypothetical protein RCL1_004223 [Eukaryota sp. TZLM3-RCL]
MSFLNKLITCTAFVYTCDKSGSLVSTGLRSEARKESTIACTSIITCFSSLFPSLAPEVLCFRRLSSAKVVPLLCDEPPFFCQDLDTSSQFIFDSTLIDRFFPSIDNVNAPLSSLPCHNNEIYIVVIQHPPPSCPSEIARSVGHTTMFLDHNSFATHYLTASRHFFPSVSLFSEDLLWLNDGLRVLNRREVCLDHTTLVAARDIMITSSSLPQKEVTSYQKRLSHLLGTALKVEVFQGSHGIDLCCTSKSALTFGATVKLDQGSGDALTQILVSYQQFWESFHLYEPSFRAVNFGFLPCILAEIKGHFLSLYGAVTVIRHGQFHRVVEHFITTSLLFNKHNEFEVHYLANILCLLSGGIKKLTSFYNCLLQGPSLDLSGCEFPVLCSNEFTYLEQIHPTSPVYLATNNNTGRYVVLKFARSYNEEIHSLFAEHHLAPSLFSFRRLGDQLFLTEMEYLPPENFRPLSSFLVLTKADKQRVFNQLEQINSFMTHHNIVHGDLRTPNLFVSLHDYSLKVVDFDYAGWSGSTRLPLFIDDNVLSKIGGSILDLEMNMIDVNAIMKLFT